MRCLNNCWWVIMWRTLLWKGFFKINIDVWRLIFNLFSPKSAGNGGLFACKCLNFLLFIVKCWIYPPPNQNLCLCIYLWVCSHGARVCVIVLIMFTSALNCTLIRCTIPFHRQVLGRVTPEISGKIYSVVSNSFHRYTHFVSSGYFKQMFLLNAEIGRETQPLSKPH